jgi:hypothetical protein
MVCIFNVYMITFNIKNEIDKINKLNEVNNIELYSFNNLNFNDKFNLLYELTEIPNNYKMHKYNNLNIVYNIYNFIIDNLNELYNQTEYITIAYNIYNKMLENNLLRKLTNLNKGQYLLKKIEHIIKNFLFTDEDYITYLIDASQNGTFCTFNFWLKKIDYVNDLTYETILINSISNSDDRIYKVVLSKTTLVNDSLIKSMLTSLALSNVPVKYILRRLKLLYNYVDLKLYFRHMIENFRNKHIILKIFKYYYSEPVDYYILNYTINLLFDDTFNNIIDIYNIVQTEKEKVCIDIILSVKYYPINNYKRDIDYTTDFITNIIKNIINENMYLILYDINWYYFYKNELNIKILKLMTNNNLITKNLTCENIEFIDLHLLFFTRFLTIKSHENNTTNKIKVINFILHKLRILAKKIIKKNLIIKKAKMIDLLIEIKTFLPNKNKPVLKNGSLNYQYEKENFNNSLFKNNINGVLVNNLPINTYPYIDIINKYQIKAEYIEEKELYMIYDINIPNTTFIERQNILRNIHTATKNIKYDNTNFNLIIENENKNINTFLLTNKKTIKWYPKFTLTL